VFPFYYVIKCPLLGSFTGCISSEHQVRVWIRVVPVLTVIVLPVFINIIRTSGYFCRIGYISFSSALPYTVQNNCIFFYWILRKPRINRTSLCFAIRSTHI
jgi:hypothetical protein